MGAFRRQLLKSFHHTVRYGTFLIFEYKVITADDNLLIIDLWRNAMGNNIFNLRMKLLMYQTSLHSCLYNCFGHRMREMFFQAGCNTKEFVFTHTVKGNHLFHSRLSLRKSTCLIKDDGICFCHGFKISSAFDSDMVIAGFTDRWQNWNRHS